MRKVIRYSKMYDYKRLDAAFHQVIERDGADIEFADLPAEVVDTATALVRCARHFSLTDKIHLVRSCTATGRKIEIWWDSGRRKWEIASDNNRLMMHSSPVKPAMVIYKLDSSHEVEMAAMSIAYLIAVDTVSDRKTIMKGLVEGVLSDLELSRTKPDPMLG